MKSGGRTKGKSHRRMEVGRINKKERRNKGRRSEWKRKKRQRNFFSCSATFTCENRPNSTHIATCVDKTPSCDWNLIAGLCLLTNNNHFTHFPSNNVDLVHCTNEPNVSIPHLANLLVERTQNANWVVVYKALLTAHHLLAYGNEVIYPNYCSQIK